MARDDKPDSRSETSLKAFFEKMHEEILQSLETRHKLDSADFSDGDLRSVQLNNATLKSADLSNTDLSYASLRAADLSETELSGSILLFTDFRNSNNLTAEQFIQAQPPLLCNVALPNHITAAGVNPNENCETTMPNILEDRYSISKQKAQTIISEARKKTWD